jgi:TnpA family transposase
MKVRIYNKTYRINNRIVISAKKTLLRILEKVRTESEVRGFSAYYTGFVVMMYIVSSTLLQEFSSDNIKSISEEIEKEKL